MTNDELAAHARAIIDSNLYLTMGTADRGGRPWTNPVYFAAGPDYREFYWVSTIDARHSVNLAERAELSLVIFDSTVATYHGRAVYAEAEAGPLEGDELDRGLAIYPGPATRGATSLTRADVSPPAPYRLYRAVASHLWVLCPRPPRQPCPLHGIAVDHRASVTP